MSGSRSVQGMRCILAALAITPGACLYTKVESESGIEAALKATNPNAGDWDYLLAAGSNLDERKLTDEEATTLRRINADGSITLISRSPSAVMYHLTTTLRNREYDLLLEQVISEKTKSEYRKRGADPMDAVKYLAKRQQDIQALFAAMPLGDQTPGVLIENIGPNQFRLAPPVAISQDLRFRQFDVIIEQREFRLLMIR